MESYSKECIRAFLEHQTQLFDELVAETVSEARAALQDNMAVELNTLQEARDFLEENGMDISGMSDEEFLKQSEVFPLPSGRFLVIPV